MRATSKHWLRPVVLRATTERLAQNRERRFDLAPALLRQHGPDARRATLHPRVSHQPGLRRASEVRFTFHPVKWVVRLGERPMACCWKRMPTPTKASLAGSPPGVRGVTAALTSTLQPPPDHRWPRLDDWDDSRHLILPSSLYCILQHPDIRPRCDARVRSAALRSAA